MLDPGRNFSQPKSHAHSFNPVIHNYSTKNYIVRAQKSVQNHRKWNSTAEFVAGKIPQNRQKQNRYRSSLSPSSRTEAIARGQKELMEMVSKMPEGCYELTLKDIVEQRVVDQHHDLGEQETNSKQRSHITVNEEKKMSEKKARTSRKGSRENGGFLLKMVFPVSWNSRNQSSNGDNKNKNVVNSMGRGRVSSKELLFDFGKGKGEGENRFEEKDEGFEGGDNGGSIKSRGSNSNSR